MKNKIKEFLPYLIILVVVLLIKAFLFTTIRVNGSSMYSTLHDKDIMIMDEISYKIKKIKRFDIIVIDDVNTKLIKRVIALPGETIKYENNKLFINDEEIEDKYNKIEMDDFLVTLESDEYFVMGDNRGDSLDSRYIGPINKSQIMGHATFTIFPFNRISGIK